VVINYYNYNNNANSNVNNNINNIKLILRLLSDIEISNDKRFNDLENKISALENKLVILLEIQDKYLKEIKDDKIKDHEIKDDEIKDDEYDIISLKS